MHYHLAAEPNIHSRSRSAASEPHRQRALTRRHNTVQRWGNCAAALMLEILTCCHLRRGRYARPTAAHIPAQLRQGTQGEAHLQLLWGAAGLPHQHGHERRDPAAEAVARYEERPAGVVTRGARERLGRVAVHERRSAQHALMHVGLPLEARQVHGDRLRVEVGKEVAELEGAAHGEHEALPCAVNCDRVARPACMPRHRAAVMVTAQAAWAQHAWVITPLVVLD